MTDRRPIAWDHEIHFDLQERHGRRLLENDIVRLPDNKRYDSFGNPLRAGDFILTCAIDDGNPPEIKPMIDCAPEDLAYQDWSPLKAKTIFSSYINDELLDFEFEKMDGFIPVFKKIRNL